MVKIKGDICEGLACHATCILRMTLGFVLVYYATMKLFFGAAPPVDLIVTFLPTDVSLFLMGMLEFVLGTLLLMGLFTRTAAWLTAVFFVVLFGSALYLHVSGILPDLWYTAFLAKDVALLGAAVSLGLQGAPCCSLDAWIRKKANR
jgi:uncharacterized membrane protein YphA (DoxX/SURF4 family)